MNETLYDSLLTHQKHFYAKHIQEVANIAADLFSHLQVSEFKTRFH